MTRLRPSGSRYITTFKKLPTQAPYTVTRIHQGVWVITIFHSKKGRGDKANRLLAGGRLLATRVIDLQPTVGAAGQFGDPFLGRSKD